MPSPIAKVTTRPRPKLFRALGQNEPPAVIFAGDRCFSLLDCLKHDSWAATAIYSDGTEKIVCKFNRQQSIFFVPMGWLGRRLARREADMLQRLSDLDAIPQACGPISCGKAIIPNAVAHIYIEGAPLRREDSVDDKFFPRLRILLDEIHSRKIAYVDLHKIENIIVDMEGKPNLIDFQISYSMAEHGNRWWRPDQKFILATLQRTDNFNFTKHMIYFRPDLMPPEQRDIQVHMPSFILWHRRLIGDPFRKLRRGLLKFLLVRSGSGEADSEVFPEDAVRRGRRTMAAGVSNDKPKN